MTRSKGEGSIRQRGPNRWQIGYDVPAGPDGKRRQRYVTVQGTERQARTQLQDLLSLKNKGALPTAGHGTFAAFTEKWLTARIDSNVLRPQTADWYERMTRVHILPVIGTVKLKDITADHLRSVLRSVRENGKSPSTQASTHTVLRTMFKWAVREGLIVSNPMLRVDAPGGARHEVQAPDIDTVRAILAELAHLPYGLAYRLLAFSGARRSEIAAMKWENVDFTAGTITIAGTLVNLRGGLEFMPTKTRSSNRIVSLDPESMSMLRQYRAKQSEAVLAAGGAIRDDGWLFTSPDGGMLRPQYLTDNWVAAYKRLDVHWPLHSLRHAHITQLLANGVPIKVVQRRAGHSNIATTLNTYAHVLPGQDEAAASVFAKVMNGSGD